MAIFNLDNMRELYSENTDMSLDEAFEVLDDFLNEGNRQNANLAGAVARFRGMGDDDDDVKKIYKKNTLPAAKNAYAGMSDEKLKLNQKVMSKAANASDAYIEKTGRRTTKALGMNYDDLVKSDREKQINNASARSGAKVSLGLANAEAKKRGLPIVKPQHNSADILKEACLTILEALENYEEN